MSAQFDHTCCKQHTGEHSQSGGKWRGLRRRASAHRRALAIISEAQNVPAWRQVLGHLDDVQYRGQLGHDLGGGGRREGSDVDAVVAAGAVAPRRARARLAGAGGAVARREAAVLLLAFLAAAAEVPGRAIAALIAGAARAEASRIGRHPLSPAGRYRQPSPHRARGARAHVREDAFDREAAAVLEDQGVLLRDELERMGLKARLAELLASGAEPVRAAQTAPRIRS